MKQKFSDIFPTQLSKIICAILLLIVLALLELTTYYYNRYQIITRENRTQSVLNKQSPPSNVIEAVGKLMELPQEEPITASVTDNNLLAGEEFFKYAVNGDKVLIYPVAKKGIIYRPDTNKIITVETIEYQTGSANSQQASPSADTQQNNISPGVLHMDRKLSE